MESLGSQSRQTSQPGCSKPDMVVTKQSAETQSWQLGLVADSAGSDGMAAWQAVCWTLWAQSNRPHRLDAPSPDYCVNPQDNPWCNSGRKQLSLWGINLTNSGLCSLFSSQVSFLQWKQYLSNTIYKIINCSISHNVELQDFIEH